MKGCGRTELTCSPAMQPTPIGPLRRLNSRAMVGWMGQFAIVFILMTAVVVLPHDKSVCFAFAHPDFPLRS